MNDLRDTDSLSVAALIETLEHSPTMAYLLRATSSDFVLEAVNKTARRPALHPEEQVAAVARQDQGQGEGNSDRRYPRRSHR